MMDWGVERMSKEEKLRMMEEIMPDLYPEEMMTLMMDKMDPTTTMEVIHEMMPRIMANCLDRMEIHDREKMFTFCTKMLRDLKERFQG